MVSPLHHLQERLKAWGIPATHITQNTATQAIITHSWQTKDGALLRAVAAHTARKNPAVTVFTFRHGAYRPRLTINLDAYPDHHLVEAVFATAPSFDTPSNDADELKAMLRLKEQEITEMRRTITQLRDMIEGVNEDAA